MNSAGKGRNMVLLVLRKKSGPGPITFLRYVLSFYELERAHHNAQIEVVAVILSGSLTSLVVLKSVIKVVFVTC